MSLVLAARASLSLQSGVERGRRTQEPKCSKECLCFQFYDNFVSNTSLSVIDFFHLDSSPKVVILGGKAHTSLVTRYLCAREQQVPDQQEECQVLQEASLNAP